MTSTLVVCFVVLLFATEGSFTPTSSDVMGQDTVQKKGDVPLIDVPVPSKKAATSKKKVFKPAPSASAAEAALQLLLKDLPSAEGDDGGSCTEATCGALDPVSNPAYNMREVAKQVILLEEHLVEANKYCRDCIIKHFLHITGLVEEAQMLAGESAPAYPLLTPGADFCRAQMDAWLQGEADVADGSAAERTRFRLGIAGHLREFRKRLVALYFPSGRCGAQLPQFTPCPE